MGSPPFSLWTLLWNVIKEKVASDQAASSDAITTLSLIREAATLTLQYEAWRKNSDEKRDTEREIGISSKWHLAAIRLYPYSEELSRRLDMKGSYWEQPEKWNELEVKEARIGLEQVVDETNRLLKNWIKKR